MLDHVLGKPSAKSRRLQVLAVLAFWSAYLLRGNKNGPPIARNMSRLLSKKLTAWQVVVLTMIYLYAARNFSTLIGLASPDPLANMYDRAFFRATWVLTALDAGFWTAMKIRTRWIRDLASILFSGFYLFATEKADEKVRKVRGNLTVEHLRVSWNKGNTAYLGFLQGLVRPRLTRWPARRVRISRPASSDYKEPIMAWLFYDGSLEQLKSSRINRVVLDIPGGGFVAMDPRCNDDRLFCWAVQTGLPILSLDYRKAPEYPFPYALNECYDTYVSLVSSRGRCIGLAAQDPVRIVVSGDSAGGNLATSMTLMLAQSAPDILSMHDDDSSAAAYHRHAKKLPQPEGLILFYPALDMNIGNWMSDEQMALIKDRSQRTTNKNVVRRKTYQYSDLAGTPHESDDEDLAVTALAGDDADSDSSSDDDGAAENGLSPRPAYSHVNMATYDGKGVHSSSRPQTPKRSNTPTPGGMAPLTKTGTNGSDDKKANEDGETGALDSYHPNMLRTRLATSSTISYFNDRVLTPEMMRAMIILYVGPHNRPDFAKDYLLSPVLAPDMLLAHFPKTYFLTGERDPLVDDTVIFAGRLRRVKAAFYASGGRRLEYRESDMRAEGFEDRDVNEVVLIPGVSHGFLQFPAVYPPAFKWIKQSANWIEDAFLHAEEMQAQFHERTRARSRTRKDRRGTLHMHKVHSSAPASPAATAPGAAPASPRKSAAARKGLGVDIDRASSHVGQSLPSAARTESSGEEDGPLEMMRMTKAKGKDTAGGAAEKPAGKKEAGSSTKGPQGDGPAASAGAHIVIKEPVSTGDASTANGSAKAAAAKKKRSLKQRAKDEKDLVKLASSDDLLGRRMKGIVGGLSGVTEE